MSQLPLGNHRTTNLIESEEVTPRLNSDFEEYCDTHANVVDSTTADQVLEANFTDLASPLRSGWIFDSGVNTHITGDSVGLTNYVSLSSGSTVATAGGATLDIKGKGNLSFDENKVNNVLYVPSARRNLLSVGSLADLGHTVSFMSEQCIVLDKNQNLRMYGIRDPCSRLYTMVPKPPRPMPPVFIPAPASPSI